MRNYDTITTYGVVEIASVSCLWCGEERMQRRIPIRVPAVTRWLCCAVQRKVSASLPERGLVSLGGQKKSLPFPWPFPSRRRSLFSSYSSFSPHFRLLSDPVQSNRSINRRQSVYMMVFVNGGYFNSRRDTGKGYKQEQLRWGSMSR